MINKERIFSARSGKFTAVVCQESPQVLSFLTVPPRLLWPCLEHEAASTKGTTVTLPSGRARGFLCSTPILHPAVAVVLNVKVCSQSNPGQHSALALPWGSVLGLTALGGSVPGPGRGTAPPSRSPTLQGSFRADCSAARLGHAVPALP